MGRKTQITKERILETALQILLRDGYEAITIKSLAAAIGCSTQPIVWHFENMNGFRKAFYEYCMDVAKSQFTVWNGSLEDLLTETARGYITIASNMPNLFRFVFADDQGIQKNIEVVQAMQLDSTTKLVQLLCQEKGLTEEQAKSFLMDYEFYIHGIASYTASGFCNYSEAKLIAMANRARDAFLACEKEMNAHAAQ